MRTSTDTLTQWLDAEEMSAWRSYAETVFDLNAALEADLTPHGLTLGDYQVLVYLSEATGQSMRMCDLAARLQLSPSGLTRRLDGLVRATEQPASRLCAACFDGHYPIELPAADLIGKHLLEPPATRTADSASTSVREGTTA